MCGIVGFIPESKPTFEMFDLWMESIEVRGRDGFGILSINTKNDDVLRRKELVQWSKLSLDKKVKIYIDVFHIDPRYERIEDLLILAISRNAPETESMTETLDNIQPIVHYLEGLFLVHNGAITSKYVEKYKAFMKTEIDSEAIIWSYIHNGRDITKAIEDLSGGWSFIMYDSNKKRLYVGSSFLPLAHGYIRGLGYLVHSDLETIKKTTELYKGLPKVKYTRLWEDFYFNELSNYKIYEIDIDSKLVINRKYKHKFVHPTWKQEEINKTKVLVLHSGGIDSTTTLIFLKELGYDVEALHFNYGQKSAEAEYVASKTICEKLDIPFKYFNLSDVYSNMSKSSMLTNPDIKIETGSKYKTKTTQAWTPGRNLMFMTIAASYAEELILTNQYDKVYIAGGFPNISEESVYPDNSRRFVESFLSTIELGLLAGKHIKWINIFAGLTKKEELWIMKQLGYEDIYGLTVSCDHAIVEDGEVKQCWCKDKNDVELPACGSGKLSYFASRLIGLDDTRKYYNKECDKDYEHYIPGWMNQSDVSINIDVGDILSRIILPDEQDKKAILKLLRVR